MDCINLMSKLDGIESLKLEGRRRKPEEIKKILNQINNKIESKKNSGYLLGTNIKDNNLYEKINTRTNPVMMASNLANINENDICLEYKEGIPINFSKDYNNPNVMYIYTEIKKDYDVNKKNLSLDLDLENNIVKQVLYVNHKGTGHTFFGNDKDLIEFNINELIERIESKNNNINIYKIKYKRNNDNKILINKYIYQEIIDYIVNDCKKIKFIFRNNKVKFEKIYLETKFLNVIDEFIDDNFIKIIYDISSIENLRNLESIINKYGDKIVYKLPLFNWKSENLEIYLKLLENKEVMFTRLTQIYLCKNLKFKKKYTDYTIYVWNKKALEFLKNNEIDEFTASFELSYNTNKMIFEKNSMQVILCGKLPMVYTRNCFSHLFGCANCKKNQNNCKQIKNYDKNLNFEIMCNSDFRYVLNSEPILNDFSKFDITDQTTFRYVSIGQDIESIKKTIECLKGNNYYKQLIKQDYWKNSYECNLIEGKE